MVAEIPLVLIDVMRQGSCQGAPTSPAQGDFMQARWGTHGDHSMASFGDGYRRFVSGILHDDTGFPPPNNPTQVRKAVNHLLDKVKCNQEDMASWEEYHTEDAEMLILSAGLVSRSAKSAVDKAQTEGIKVGLFRPITLWPFPKTRFAQLCAKVKTVMTVEMNDGQLAEVAAKYMDNTQKLIAVTQNDGTMIREEKVLRAIKDGK